MKITYECSECGRGYKISPTIMVCPVCSKLQKNSEPLRGVLEVRYQGKTSKLTDLLPIETKFFPKIPVGNTPLWDLSHIRPNLFIKDDSFNPSASFKDRASYMVAAFAKKFKIKEIVLASTGNAGSSMSGIGAASGINITLFLPETAPIAKIVQSLQFGANVHLVKGNYDKAYDLSLEYSKRKSGVMNRNTAYNPMTIEGKKTVSLEIFKQLNNHAPDYVFVPTGDGCILGGVYKGFFDLLSMKLIKKMPTVVAVQASGSNAIALALLNGYFTPINSSTIADSISVDVPRNGYHALAYLKKYRGMAVEVSDDEILDAQKSLAESAGIFTEPASACAYAGFLKIQGTIPRNKKIVVMATGSGLKDVTSALKRVLKPKKSIDKIEEILC